MFGAWALSSFEGVFQVPFDPVVFLVKGCADIMDIIYSSLILQFVKGTCFTNLLSPTSSLYCLSYRKTLKFDSYLNLLLGKVFQ